MKTPPLSILPMLVGSAALASLLCPARLQAADGALPVAAEQAIPASVFVMPQPGMQLKDPFFPNSTRFQDTQQPVVVAAQEPTLDDLTLKAISGSVERPLAMINEHTFAVGEEREVRTPHGRIRVRLIAVEGLKATIAVGEQTRELRLRSYETAPANTGEPATPETVQVSASDGR